MLSKPYGNKLIKRILLKEEKKRVIENASSYKKILMDDELVKDVRNIARGVFSPLEGFMNKLELDTVIDEMQLPSGVEWTIPIILDVEKQQADAIEIGEQVLLTDNKGNNIALFSVFEEVNHCYERAFELLYLTVSITENRSRLRELLRFREMLTYQYINIEKVANSTANLLILFTIGTLKCSKRNNSRLEA